ncbi:MAG: DUF4097 family beta strand repeat protein [Gemmatimonadota bacterium]|nr:MAG: DUF4097 family beta strand repeat protein [Gemmatimonadota bacterium]
MRGADLRPRPAGLAVYFVSLALISTGCDLTTGPSTFAAEADFSFTVEVTTQVRLRVAGVNGAIVVIGVPGSTSLLVEGVRRVTSDSQEDADAHLDSLEVLVEEGVEELLVSTDQPAQSGGRSYVVNYEVRVPDDLAVVIENANGAIVVLSISNNVDIVNGNGDILLESISGSSSVQLGNGAIDAEITLPLDGFIGMNVGNGAITLGIPQSTSAWLAAQTGVGRVNVVNLTLQDAEITNSSVSGRLGDGEGDIVLNLGNGDITVAELIDTL